VRVVTLAVNTDWYIDQLKRQYYESMPLPLTMPSEKYVGEKTERGILCRPGVKDTIELKGFV